MPGMVVGVDGSPGSARALEWAMKTAAGQHAPVLVLAVHQAHATSQWTGHPADAGSDVLASVRSAVQEMVEKAASSLGTRSPAVAIKAVSGSPAEELIRASQTAELVVVGSRGHGGFSRLMLGSVGDQVVRHAACPVVVVPSGR